MSGADGQRIAVQDTGDVVYLARLPRGPITVLAGTAVTIWRAAIAGPTERVADQVAAVTGWDAEEIRESVDGFVGELLSEGLITQSQ